MRRRVGIVGSPAITIPMDVAVVRLEVLMPAQGGASLAQVRVLAAANDGTHDVLETTTAPAFVCVVCVLIR